jgi:hypothetical protein
MATCYINVSKSTVARSGIKSSWSAARNATSANDFTDYDPPQPTATCDQAAVREFSKYSTRPEKYAVNRYFHFFDFSSIEGTITAINLQVDSCLNNLSGFYVCTAKSTAFGGDGTSAFVASDFNNWSPGSPTPYSSTSGEEWSQIPVNENDFSLNATAINDANTNGYLNIVIVGAANDYPDNSPTSDFDRKAPAEMQTNSFRRCIVVYTPTAWSHNINGVAAKSCSSSGYDEINSVSYDVIRSVNGVDFP